MSHLAAFAVPDAKEYVGDGRGEGRGRQPNEGKIKAREVRFGRGVLDQVLGAWFCDVRLWPAPRGKADLPINLYA